MMERIDKLLAQQAGLSRRAASDAVRRGRVLLNGAAVKSAAQKADPETDRLALDGKPLAYQKNLWLMLHKPAGVLSAARDQKQKTVLDLVPPELRRKGLFPAGRLDKDTTGLLLLTDDGELAHRMLSPKRHVWKVYEARLDLPLPPDAAERFRAGISVKEFEFLPAELELLETGETPLCRVRVREGKFHQVRRMFGALGCTVTALKRVKIGGLALDQGLLPGECRPLTQAEADSIFSGGEQNL